MVGWNSVKLVKNLNLFNFLAFLFSPVNIIRIISSEKYIKKCSTYIFVQQRTIRQQLSVRVFVFPGPRPFAWPPTLALAPNLCLPTLALNLYLPALAPNLYLPALAPNLYLPALAPNLYLPALAPNLYIPALAPPICIYRPWSPPQICIYQFRSRFYYYCNYC